MNAEHTLQLTLLDTLEQAIAESQPPAKISSLLDQFVEYTFVHFISEQVLMQRMDYPGFQAHKQTHDELLREVREAQAEAGATPPNAELVTRLRAWLIVHIEGMDRAFGDFLEKKGEPA